MLACTSFAIHTRRPGPERPSGNSLEQKEGLSGQHVRARSSPGYKFAQFCQSFDFREESQDYTVCKRTTTQALVAVPVDSISKGGFMPSDVIEALKKIGLRGLVRKGI